MLVSESYQITGVCHYGVGTDVTSIKVAKPSVTSGGCSLRKKSANCTRLLLVEISRWNVVMIRSGVKITQQALR